MAKFCGSGEQWNSIIEKPKQVKKINCYIISNIVDKRMTKSFTDKFREVVAGAV